MIQRYTRPEMGRLWDIEAKYKKWLDVEIAVCEAWQQLGRIPASALKAIKQKAKINVSDILKIEKVTKHDVIAFLTSLEKYIGDNSKYVHLGLTSSDVVDTAFILLTLNAAQLIRPKLIILANVLKKLFFNFVPI